MENANNGGENLQGVMEGATEELNLVPVPMIGE